MSQSKFFEEQSTLIMNWFLCRQLQARGAAPRPAAGCRSSATAADAKMMSISEKFLQVFQSNWQYDVNKG